jgi:hypothetical protein
MFPPDKTWEPEIDWGCPAGRTLEALLEALKDAGPLTVTVFGSAPLQLGIDNSFLSADVDVICPTNLTPYIEASNLGPGQQEIYVQQSDEVAFSVAASWRDRAYVVKRNNVTLVIPHPIDILVAKLPRLEPKDLDAFRLVLDKTGHPTADELISALQRNVDMFKPNFDEENSGDPVANTQRLWRELYSSGIDVRKEIIVPAVQRRKAGYGQPPELRRELHSFV